MEKKKLIASQIVLVFMYLRTLYSSSASGSSSSSGSSSPSSSSMISPPITDVLCLGVYLNMFFVYKLFCSVEVANAVVDNVGEVDFVFGCKVLLPFLWDL